MLTSPVNLDFVAAPLIKHSSIITTSIISQGQLHQVAH